MAVFNPDRPKPSDRINPAPETQANFEALDRLIGKRSVALTGANAAATDLDTTTYGDFRLTTDAETGANDFDLTAPGAANVGQMVTVYLVTKNTQNATVTEKSGGCVILANNGGAVASITLDAADEFVVLRAISATTWVIVATNGTVA